MDDKHLLRLGGGEEQIDDRVRKSEGESFSKYGRVERLLRKKCHSSIKLIDLLVLWEFMERMVIVAIRALLSTECMLSPSGQPIAKDCRTSE